MKILLVWPNKDDFGFKPMNMALISGILKQNGHQVELFDATPYDFGYKGHGEVLSKIKIFKPIDFSKYDISKKKVDLQSGLISKLDDFKPDVVGVSALSDEVFIGLKVSRIVKKWNSTIPILWGNKAATMGPDKILNDDSVDYICVGEGIEFIKEFVDCIANGEDPKRLKNITYKDENGHVVQNEIRPFFQDIDSLPYYDWSIFDKRHFLKPYDGKIYVGGDHMIHWGCPNDCSYCINHAYRKLFGPKAGKFLRWYSVDRIIKELQFLVEKWGITFFKFYDEDFCIKPMSYFRQLAEKYQRCIGVPFTAMANARNLTDEKVALLKQMNCVSISIGIETGNKNLRKNVLNRTETTEDIIKGLELLHNAGIRTSAFNMLGIPFESRSTIMETIEVNRKSQVQYPNTVFFYPLEGTKLRDVSIEEGLFDADSDSVFDHTRPALKLPDISEEELIALRERFILYIKLPKKYHKYIEISEQSTEVGGKLTEELYSIYDQYVFQHNGQWCDGGENDKIIERLEGCMV